MTRVGAMIRDILSAFLRVRRERWRERDEARRILMLYLRADEFSRAREELRGMREPPPRELCDSESVFKSVTTQWRAIHGVSIGDQHADHHR